MNFKHTTIKTERNIMSSLIEFRNLTFNGDQVTFDIHIPLHLMQHRDGNVLYYMGH